MACSALAAALLCVSCLAEDDALDDGLTADDEDRITFEEFEDSVFQEPETGLYIVEGDLPIRGLDELHDYYLENVAGVASLALDRPGGVDAPWTSVQAQNLSYCVSTSFGADYDTMVEAMARAAAAWESAANINLVHQPNHDASCDPSTPVVFDVRPVSNVFYIARAFFPNDPRADRNLLVTAEAFTDPTYSLDGILRHELGHVLGFRHEHTRPETGMCFEDNDWSPLSPYDSDSVMHYPWCNGTNAGDLFLTARDRVGAASVYGFGDGNLARMGDNSASSTYCTVAPATTHCYDSNRINDGSTSTALGGDHSWTNNGGGMPQWVEIELGHRHAFNRAVLHMTSDYEMRDYEIQYWDGSAWQVAVAETGNTDTVDTHTFDTVYGSRLRVVGQLGPVGQPGYVRVNELQVFNDHENLATASKVSASSTYCSGLPGGSLCYDVGNVIDSDVRTNVGGQYSWANNGGGMPQWVELDFVGERDISQIELYTSAGYPIRDFDIQSWNGGGWTTQYVETGNTSTSWVQPVFPFITTTRLRVLGRSGPNNQPGYVRINEIKVY